MPGAIGVPGCSAEGRRRLRWTCAPSACSGEQHWAFSTSRNTANLPRPIRERVVRSRAWLLAWPQQLGGAGVRRLSQGESRKAGGRNTGKKSRAGGSGLESSGGAGSAVVRHGIQLRTVAEDGFRQQRLKRPAPQFFKQGSFPLLNSLSNTQTGAHAGGARRA